MKAALFVIAFAFYVNCNAQVKEKRPSSSQGSATLREYVSKAENHLSHAEEVAFPGATDSALFYARKAEKLSISKPDIARSLFCCVPKSSLQKPTCKMHIHWRKKPTVPFPRLGTMKELAMLM